MNNARPCNHSYDTRYAAKRRHQQISEAEYTQEASRTNRSGSGESTAKKQKTNANTSEGILVATNTNSSSLVRTVQLINPDIPCYFSWLPKEIILHHIAPLFDLETIKNFCLTCFHFRELLNDATFFSKTKISLLLDINRLPQWFAPIQNAYTLRPLMAPIYFSFNYTPTDNFQSDITQQNAHLKALFEQPSSVDLCLSVPPSTSNVDFQNNIKNALDCFPSNVKRNSVCGLSIDGGESGMWTSHLEKIMETFPNVTKMEISRCYISNNFFGDLKSLKFFRILDKNEKLTTLVLNSVGLFTEGFNENKLIVNNEKTPIRFVKNLTINFNPRKGMNYNISLISKMINLQHLRIACRSQALIRFYPDTLLFSLENLEVLEVEDIANWEYPETITAWTNLYMQMANREKSKLKKIIWIQTVSPLHMSQLLKRAETIKQGIESYKNEHSMAHSHSVQWDLVNQNCDNDNHLTSLEVFASFTI